MDITKADIVRMKTEQQKPGRPHGIARIRRGYGLRLRPEDEHGTPWDLRRQVTLARILATDMAAKRRPVFAAQSAMAVWGVDGWTENPDVVTRRATPGRLVELPAVQVMETCVSAARATQIYLEAPFKPVERRGVLVDTPATVALHMALQAHPLEAVVAVSGLMRLMVQSGPGSADTREQLAERSTAARTYLLQHLETYAGMRGARRAARVIAASSAECENVGERAALYLLAGLTTSEVTPQHPVHLDGRKYYLDLAVPDQHVAVEFDGLGKLGATGRELQAAKQQWVDRQAALVSAGWRVVRLSWRDLDDLTRTRSLLGAQTGLGDHTDSNRSGLWVPPPASTRTWRLHGLR